MDKYFHIESQDGLERQFVQSLDGYKNWKVLGESTRVPLDGEEWDEDTKELKINAVDKAMLDWEISVSNPEDMLKRIEILESLVSKLLKEIK